MEEDSVYKQIFIKRSRDFEEDIEKGCQNENKSPVFDILRTSFLIGMYDIVRNMVLYSKPIWKKYVWDKIWQIECEDWNLGVMHFQSIKMLNEVIGGPKYSPWWQLTDVAPENMAVVETMTKILCRASKLKSDDYDLTHSHSEFL